MPEMVDSFGRVVRDLRVSVTDRCNFRCQYCMPAEGLPWLDRDELLSFEEIERLVRVLVTLGVESVRLTGGEPLVRRDFPVLVGMLGRIDGLRDLSLTTNGYLLERDAGAPSSRRSARTRSPRSGGFWTTIPNQCALTPTLGYRYPP